MTRNITLSKRTRNIILISVVLVVVIIVIFARPIPEKVRKYDKVQIHKIYLNFKIVEILRF